jgi:putative ABC transport system substrate-binding protein
VRTVGIVTSSTPVSVRSLDPLWEALRERGWIEGRNLRLEIQYVARYEQRAAAMPRFVGLPVDVIFAGSVAQAMAARDATATIPIVFWIGADPVSAGLVESYSRPGRNLTGIWGSAADGVAKTIELLLEAVPRIRRVALLANPDLPHAEALIQHARQAAHELGLQLQVVKARNAPEVTRGLAEVRRAAADALVMTPVGPLRHEYERIAAFAIANRLPLIATGSSDENLDAACLLRYGPSHPDALRRAAHHIDRILKGAKPADLPVERASWFHLVVNLKVARSIGVVVPDALLRIADEVIE